MYEFVFKFQMYALERLTHMRFDSKYFSRSFIFPGTFQYSDQLFNVIQIRTDENFNFILNSRKIQYLKFLILHVKMKM